MKSSAGAPIDRDAPALLCFLSDAVLRCSVTQQLLHIRHCARWGDERLARAPSLILELHLPFRSNGLIQQIDRQKESVAFGLDTVDPSDIALSLAVLDSMDETDDNSPLRD